MKGGDIGFNNNLSGIASRVTMEMMAFGIPVISYGGDYTTYHAKIWDLDSIAEQVEKCWKAMTKDGSVVRQTPCNMPGIISTGKRKFRNMWSSIRNSWEREDG